MKHHYEHQRHKESHSYQRNSIGDAGFISSCPIRCTAKTGFTWHKPVPSYQGRKQGDKPINPRTRNKNYGLPAGCVRIRGISFDYLIHNAAHCCQGSNRRQTYHAIYKPRPVAIMASCVHQFTIQVRTDEYRIAKYDDQQICYGDIHHQWGDGLPSMLALS